MTWINSIDDWAAMIDPLAPVANELITGPRRYAKPIRRV